MKGIYPVLDQIIKISIFISLHLFVLPYRYTFDLVLWFNVVFMLMNIGFVYVVFKSPGYVQKDHQIPIYKLVEYNKERNRLQPKACILCNLVKVNS